MQNYHTVVGTLLAISQVPLLTFSQATSPKSTVTGTQSVDQPRQFAPGVRIDWKQLSFGVLDRQ